MAKNWRTTDGEMLDDICQRHYGSAGLNQSLAAVLEANPGLADLVRCIRPGWKSCYRTGHMSRKKKETFQLWD
ncbi:tail protein X [Escherichia coli]